MLRFAVFILSLDRLIRFRSRIYGITFGNKIVMAYFGAVALTKFVVSLVSFLPNVKNVYLPPIPLDVFNLCAVGARLRFRLVPIVMGTTFGE